MSATETIRRNVERRAMELICDDVKGVATLRITSDKKETREIKLSFLEAQYLVGMLMDAGL